MFRKYYHLSSVDFLEKYAQMMLKECILHSQQLGTISQKLEGNWQKRIMDEASYIIGITRGREAVHNAISEIEKTRTKKLRKRIGAW